MKIREILHKHYNIVESAIFERSFVFNFKSEDISGVYARQKAIENSSIMMEELFPKRIIKDLVQVLEQKRANERNFRTVTNYSMPNISEKVMHIIFNEVDYMNKAVWSKK